MYVPEPEVEYVPPAPPLIGEALAPAQEEVNGRLTALADQLRGVGVSLAERRSGRGI